MANYVICFASGYLVGYIVANIVIFLDERAKNVSN